MQMADEAVVDRVLAERYDLSVGDAVTILGRSFRIVGLSEETTSWMLSMIFLHHEAAAALLGPPGTTSFVLVRTDPTVAADTVAALKDVLPETNVVTWETMAANDMAYIGGIFNAPARMMVLISLGIGVLLVGLTIYSATAERVREYGVLKALGMRNRTLYGVVLKQALGPRP